MGDSRMGFTAVQWIWLGAAAFAVGISKMGLGGVILLFIPILAGIFGGRESTGLLLPLLMTGDMLAVLYYRKHIQIHEIRRLLLWVCIGLLIGLFVGQYINDSQFKAVLSVSIILCLAVMVYADVKGKPLTVPDKLVFYALVGILGGFTSMVGNAAGPIISIYLLSKGYQKGQLISTSVWLFFIINLLKLPLQIFVWHNIAITGLYSALLLLPAMLAGAVAGAYLVKRMNDKIYRIILYGMILIAAVALWI
jgi:uncharacterized protein